MVGIAEAAAATGLGAAAAMDRGAVVVVRAEAQVEDRAVVPGVIDADLRDQVEARRAQGSVPVGTARRGQDSVPVAVGAARAEPAVLELAPDQVAHEAAPDRVAHPARPAARGTTVATDRPARGARPAITLRAMAVHGLHAAPDPVPGPEARVGVAKPPRGPIGGVRPRNGVTTEVAHHPGPPAVAAAAAGTSHRPRKRPGPPGPHRRNRPGRPPKLPHRRPLQPSSRLRRPASPRRIAARSRQGEMGGGCPQ
jgi:hypothetical protein